MNKFDKFYESYMNKDENLNEEWSDKKKDYMDRFKKVEKMGFNYFAELDGLLGDIGDGISHYGKKTKTTVNHKDVTNAIKLIGDHISKVKSEISKIK